MEESYFINNTLDNKYFTIKNTDYDNACFYKSFSNCIVTNNIHLEMSKLIQKLAYEWIINNSNLHNEDFNLSISELVLMSHDISINEYVKIYKHYAEDYIENTKERWGSLVEQIALSEIFKIPIFIYTSQKYDSKKNKITIGKIVNNKPHKGVRYKLYQQIGMKYMNDKQPICLLWKDGKYGPHYMSMFIIDNYNINEDGIPFEK
tara:strand:+ start:1673 stop:2287 length:615 start_codon:yes stop_codon:yes gene_type:complete